jgi:hypothetical protein
MDSFNVTEGGFMQSFEGSLRNSTSLRFVDPIAGMKAVLFVYNRYLQTNQTKNDLKIWFDERENLVRITMVFRIFHWFILNYYQIQILRRKFFL